MKRILITGGAGYIGSHTSKALAAHGFVPVAYDNLSTGHRWAVKWGPLEVGDIRNRARLDEVIRTHKPHAIIHFAASAYVGESIVNPGKYYDNNVGGTLHVLEAMRDHAIPYLVFSSSCATYGVPDRLPIQEGAEQRPINPYGASKLMCERMIADFSNAHDLKSITLRYFNAAGGDPDAEIGEEHDPETHLIPLILDVASGLRPAIKIFGDDYLTRDGTCIRDYVHVSDLAAAHVCALNPLLNGSDSDALNIGTGKGVSVAEAIRAVEDVTGLPVSREIAPRRSGDPAELVSDPSKANKMLGWTPKLSDINEIIRTAWLWRRRKARTAQSPQTGSHVEIAE